MIGDIIPSFIPFFLSFFLPHFPRDIKDEKRNEGKRGRTVKNERLNPKSLVCPLPFVELKKL